MPKQARLLILYMLEIYEKITQERRSDTHLIVERP